MSLAIASAPLSAPQACPVPIGHLAKAYTGKHLSLQVLSSAAGHYIGTADREGSVLRESVEYFPSREAAEAALPTGHWQQRCQP